MKITMDQMVQINELAKYFEPIPTRPFSDDLNENARKFLCDRIVFAITGNTSGLDREAIEGMREALSISSDA